MRYLIVIIIILAAGLFLSAEGFAMHQGKTVTPYGDSCAKCGKYGTCKSTISTEDAEEAMRDYYNKKGYGVEVEHAKGRFIKARIMDKDKTIDVIIFDRRTGRIRSTF